VTESPRNFVANAEAELANPQLQIALARVKAGFQERRRGAARLPEFEMWREEAKRLKDHVLDNLGFYLDRFEQRVSANGGHVHWAKTPEDARNIIREICKAAGAKTITKGKSMISEEIGLNEFLTANGMTPVETDLGEYIIQLRGERPSHIIAPAFHLNRGDVAASFRMAHLLDPARDLDSRSALVAEARFILREKFLSADVGITGANILVAETGTAVLVTNEGNGDLTQGVPRVCIALTSVEKVVPTMEDAALILRLLARSATGQDISVYTSFRSGPRGAGDADGPEEFHVVLLDNGRVAMLESPARDALRCIRCGACINHCPVYAAVGGHAYGATYPGPIGAVLNPSLIGIKEAHHHPNASTLCGRCETVCPVKIPLPSIMRSWREAGHRENLQSSRVVWALKLWHFAAMRPRFYRVLSWMIARLLWFSGGRNHRLRLLARLIGWGPNRDLPAPQGPTFHSQWAMRKQRP
jgi:L-lactate dehydrogenase complex protein LldF